MQLHCVKITIRKQKEQTLSTLDSRQIRIWPSSGLFLVKEMMRGLLLHPHDSLFEASQKMETEFFAMHGNSLSKEKHIIRTLAERTMAKLDKTKIIPLEVILYLSRTQTYIRLRDLNRKISFQNCQRKLDKKISKMTNYKK